MRVAVIGVGHWHATQMYIPVLKASGADIVAVSDPDADALERAEVECPRFLDHRELLAAAKPDFAFAMAPHCDMTALASDLVEAGQPFAMEKPMGTDWRALHDVAAKAGEKGLFAAVALVTRYYPLVEKLADMMLTGELGAPVHYYSRLFAGTPQRYRDWHVDWMLDPARAGAGPLYNFGPHVIDIFLHLFKDPITSVSASATHRLHKEAIEDLASVSFRTQGGAVGVVEVSYTHPDAYERYFSLTTTTLHVGGKIEGDTIRFRDGRVIDVAPDRTASETYEVYTADTLRHFAEGLPPKASIHDMWPTLRVLNAALASIHAGAPTSV
ncbi:MAG: Gfo/Idh/MocA family oxidoreductase [Armatimonadetes bacterium]|nr:Gfo/Idh/MocA family oxidoreductase [Armatimonadota bacterium]